MGKLWGNEYAIATGTSTGQFFDDSETESPWKLAPLTAAINDVSVARVFRREIMTGLGARIERAYQIAADGEHFTNGLLNHTLLSGTVGASETKAYLQSTLSGQAISLEYHHMAPLNLAHVGHEYLATTQGYTPWTNISSVQSAFQGFPTYLEHMELVLRHEPGADMPPVQEMPEWEVAPSQLNLPWANPYTNYEHYPSWVYTTTTATVIRLHFAWMGDTPMAGTPTALDWEANGIPELAVPPDTSIAGIESIGYSFAAAFGATTANEEDFIRRYTINVSLSSLGYVQDKDYFQTKYLRNLSGHLVLDYFTHATDAGTIPSIEDTINLEASTPTFFPLIFMRRDFETLADASNAEVTEYIENKKVCELIGFDYQKFASSILGDDEVDVSAISQAFFMFGIPISSEKQIGKRYLYEFFYWLNLNNTDRSTLGYYLDGDWYNDDAQEHKVIHFTDSSAHIRLEYIGTASTLQTGNLSGTSVSPVGYCESELLVQTQKYRIRRKIHDVWETSVGTRGINVWAFRKQVSTNRYREVLIAEPLLSYRLVDTQGGNEQYAFVTDDADLLIPLSHELVIEYFHGTEKTQLYAESLHTQINSYTKEKLSWYQTANFARVLKIAAIAITVYSLGTMGPQVQGTYAAILAFIGSTSTLAITTAIILTALFYYGLQYGLSKIFSLAVEEIGGKWGNIGAVILAVVAAYGIYTGNPDTRYWVMAANGFQEASAVQLEEDIIRFDQDLQLLAEEEDVLSDIQKTLNDELAVRENMMRAVGLKSVNNPFESASEYYARTSSGTAGIAVSVNSAELFLQTSLMLPTPNTTFGES